MTTPCTDPRALEYDPGRVVGTCPPVSPTVHLKRIGERLRVGDVMTSPAPTIEPDAPLLEVIHRLIACSQDELVVTVGARPEGIITARGILALLEPEYADWRPQRAIDLVAMGTPRLLPELKVATAVSVLNGGRHEALPVVDYRGDLIGVLTQRRLVALFAGEGTSS
jgi:CBS domain-containing protein